MDPQEPPPPLIPISVKPPTPNLAEFAAAAGEAVSKFGEYLGSCNVQDHGGGRAMARDESLGREMGTSATHGIAMSAQDFEEMKRERRARGLSEAEAEAEATATVRVDNSKIHLMNAAQKFVSQAHVSVARPYDMSDQDLIKRIADLLATSQHEAADTLTRLQDLINPATLLVADSSRQCEAVLNDIVSNFVRDYKQVELGEKYRDDVHKYIFAYITAILEFLYNIATVKMIQILLTNGENENIRNMVGSFLYFECDKYYDFLKKASNKRILDHIVSIILKLNLEDILNITLAAGAAAVVCPTVTGYTIHITKQVAAGAVAVGQAVLRLDGTGLQYYYDFLGRYLKIAIPIIYGVRANSGLIQIGIDKLNDVGWRLNEMVSGVQRPNQYKDLFNILPSGDSFITRLFGKVPPIVKATMSIVVGGVSSEYISAVQIFPSKPGTGIKTASVNFAKALKSKFTTVKSPEDIIRTELTDNDMLLFIRSTEKYKNEVLPSMALDDEFFRRVFEVFESCIDDFIRYLQLKCGLLTETRLALLQAEITASNPAITCQLLASIHPSTGHSQDSQYSQDSLCTQVSQSGPPQLTPEDVSAWTWLAAIFDSGANRLSIKKIKKTVVKNDPSKIKVSEESFPNVVDWLKQVHAEAEAAAEAAAAAAETADSVPPFARPPMRSHYPDSHFDDSEMGGGRSRSRKRSISKLTRRKGVAKKQKSKKNKRQSRRKSCRSSSRKDRK